MLKLRGVKSRAPSLVLELRRLLVPILILVVVLIVVPVGSQTAQPLQTNQPVQTNQPSGQSQGQGTNSQQEELKKQQEKLKKQEELRFWAYFCVIFGGAFGGLIYGVSRNRGAVIPHRLRLQDGGSGTPLDKLDLGFIGDMVIGIGGGIIVFNLVPQADSDIFESLLEDGQAYGKLASLLMKITALSLIGGFAGISLFDEAAKRISRELEEVKEQAGANRGLITQLQGVGDLEADIQYLLNPLVDTSFPPLTESQKDEFRKLLLKAPLNLRNKVFERLQNAHNANLISGNEPSLKKSEVETRLTLQESLLAGFDSLIAAAEEQEQKQQGTDAFKHRYLAHKGFIHDQIAIGYDSTGLQVNTIIQHWRQGEEHLSKAIQLRDQIPPDREMYWYYSLERMLCRFELGRRDEVIAEINSEDVQKWIQKEPGIVSSQLKLLSRDFLEFLKSQWRNKPQWKDLITSIDPEKPIEQPPVQNGHGGAQTVTTVPQSQTPPPTASAQVGSPPPALTPLPLQHIQQRDSL